MPIDVDHSSPKVSDTPRGHLHGVLCGDAVAVRRQHDIDGVALRIQCPI